MDYDNTNENKKTKGGINPFAGEIVSWNSWVSFRDMLDAYNSFSYSLFNALVWSLVRLEKLNNPFFKRINS
jgi:hypothetical protein